MIRTTLFLCGLLAAVLAAQAAFAQSPDLAKYIVGSKKSGYVFAAPETRSMMDDDFDNPAFLWVEMGTREWNKVAGEAGKSCASCHGDAKGSMRGVGAAYPKFDPKAGKVIDIEQRINLCRMANMKASEFKWESDELLGMTAFVKLQSRWMPVAVKVDGPAAPTFERGKALYFERRGQRDLSCANCHIDNQGRMLRAELLSQGQANGFPTYRLKWQRIGSLQKRITGCNEEIFADPYPLGSDENTALELYLAWRGNGLPVESPSVRK